MRMGKHESQGGLIVNTYVHRVSTPDLAAALGTTNPEPDSA